MDCTDIMDALKGKSRRFTQERHFNLMKNERHVALIPKYVHICVGVCSAPKTKDIVPTSGSQIRNKSTSGLYACIELTYQPGDQLKLIPWQARNIQDDTNFTLSSER